MEPVKEGHRSGSYDDKKNTVMKTAAGLRYDQIGPDDIVMSAIDQTRKITDLLMELQENDVYFHDDATNFLLGVGTQKFGQTMLARANRYPRVYRQAVHKYIQYGGGIPNLIMQTATNDPSFSIDLINLANATLLAYEGLGISVDKVITQGATQLANFLIDGTYNFTFILFPSPSQPNGAVGTGTAAIDSEYDGYTHGLAQKIINQNITTPFSMNILQTLDISYNSILIDTYGTSNTGKYTIEGNILTIYSYGYSNGTIFFGEFINDIVKIIKTDIGYIVQHNKINPDNSIGPLIDVVYYVRQLTIPDEDAKKFEQLFQTRDKDGDGFIDRLTAQGLVDGALFTTSKIALPTNVSAYIGPALLGYILCYVGPT